MLKVLVVGQGAHGDGGDCSSETSSASGLLRRRRGRGYNAYQGKRKAGSDAYSPGEDACVNESEKGRTETTWGTRRSEADAAARPDVVEVGALGARG